MPRAQLKLDFRVVFRRDGAYWRGEALELDAHGSSASLRDAVSALLGSAYQAAQAALAQGDLPGRVIPPVLLEEWKVLVAGGSRVELADIYAGEQDLSVVATELSVLAIWSFDALPREIAEHRVLLMKDEGFWVAQALEFDLCARGTDIKDALQRLRQVVFGRALLDATLGMDPLGEVPQAPSLYFERYAGAEELDTRARIAA
ncbi:hypothetical protein G6O69_12310 [Pseudenhygromyxa sp. WMMC2535]|uniref:hypothetical protein n=1 Tax=Pseudenhygromyxa sp. WMMC2535 TaxID=2712867 RepID=UPI0015523EE5|nr:hypothetical protein [Pseudenhygromyxa sp. WMMC2535]NVB38615.1 hypothetical protein [Pseudenhygromyxa sp. WMMC2535]